MFSKENVKVGALASIISAVVSGILWLATHFGGGGNTPGPQPSPIPLPDETKPIAVASEVYCAPGTTVAIEPKFIGSIEWSVPPPYEKKIKAYPFDDKLIVNVVPGVNEPIYVAISGIHTKKDGKAAASSVVYVKINTSEGPQPKPNPVPPPPPILPDGKYKLSKLVYNSVISNVPSDLRKGPSGEFQKNYEGIASKIVAGGYSGYMGSTMIQAILKDTTEANQSSLKNLGASITPWEPVFVSLQDELWNNYQGKKLNTSDEFATAWREIAVGFDATAK